MSIQVRAIQPRSHLVNFPMIQESFQKETELMIQDLLKLSRKDDKNTESINMASWDSKIPSLLVFPELFLFGYPTQDLCIQKTIIVEYLHLMCTLERWCQTLFEKYQLPLHILVGGPFYAVGTHDSPDHSIPNSSEIFQEEISFQNSLEHWNQNCEFGFEVYNAIYHFEVGKKTTIAAIKELLPNYDFFEEKKYFSITHHSREIYIGQSRIGLLICEDMWFSHLHHSTHATYNEHLETQAPLEPVGQLIQNLKNKTELSPPPKVSPKYDLIINFSASPFHLNKHEERLKKGTIVSTIFNSPLLYLNKVGLEDEILFDGSSFLLHKEDIFQTLKTFDEDSINFCIPLNNLKPENSQLPSAETIKLNYARHISSSSFHGQFFQSLTEDLKTLRPLGPEENEKILNALTLSLKEYLLKTGHSHITIALSGGIDSALVLTLAKLALKDSQKIEAVYMPGFFSASVSFDASQELCKNLGIKLFLFPIKFIHSTMRNNFKETFKQDMVGLTDENIQSRIRGALIYARSNQMGSLVINTSNKSELAVGYSTLYGDSVGAFSLLGDLYKTEVYQLADYINQKYQGLIPKVIIERPPSAELRENQKDEDSLPPYAILDPILEHFLSYKTSLNDLIQLGFKKEEVEKIYRLWTRSEYKRKQFAPIIKIKSKSFGFGYRNPILKHT